MDDDRGKEDLLVLGTDARIRPTSASRPVGANGNQLCRRKRLGTDRAVLIAPSHRPAATSHRPRRLFAPTASTGLHPLHPSPVVHRWVRLRRSGRRTSRSKCALANSRNGCCSSKAARSRCHHARIVYAGRARSQSSRPRWRPADRSSRPLALRISGASIAAGRRARARPDRGSRRD